MITWNWIMFIIFLMILGGIIKWLHKEFKEAKQERLNATIDRKAMLESIKNIETETKELHKVLYPIEKRHFR